MRWIRTAATAALLVAAATSSLDAQQRALGPRDGTGLPPTDLERVSVGQVAPDFALESLAGPIIALSDYQGKKNVVLVFYRGHW